MKSLADDIQNFDDLEHADGHSLSNPELRSIHQLDQLMSGLHSSKLRPDFAASVIRAALAEKRRKSRFWFFSVLLGSGAAIVSLVWVALLFNPASSSTVYLPQVMDQVGGFLGLFSNPKVRQLLLICEAIILLIIADKVLGKFRNIRPTAH